MDPSRLLAQAVGHHRAGRLAEAEAIYREILGAHPDHVDSLHLLGVVATQRGRFRQAVELIGRAIALKKTPAAEFHSNIGLAHRGLGEHAAAIAHFERALSLEPDYAEAHNNLAAVLKDCRRFEEAEPHCRRVVQLRPTSAPAHFALGAVLQDQGRLLEAADSYRRALSLDPRYPAAHVNLGTVLAAEDRLDEAIDHYRTAIALRPGNAEAHFNLGTALQDKGEFDGALGEYMQAQALKADYADAHWNEALLRLARGDYRAGWEKYEWRWRRAGHEPPNLARPRWDGGDLTGQTILLYAEQGFGDTLQFVRYAALVKARGAKTVILECQPGLAPLLASAPGIDRVVTRGAEPLPAFDVHAPLLSLPQLFGTTPATIPRSVPYLRTPAATLDWKARLTQGGMLNVGIAWRGNPKNSRDRKRSIPVDLIAPLIATPGVNWVSLQVDCQSAEIARFSRHGQLHDFGPLLSNWSATAGLISALDLVVAVDTAVAHLAGALGKPVWVLLAFVAHWCWLRDRSDSPWYPTARLFRQPAHGDWDAILSEVGEELTRFPGGG